MDLTCPFAASLDQDLLRAHPPLARYLGRLGQTPLIKVPAAGGRSGGRIYAKAEWHNPNGTVKDRVAFGLVYRLLKATPPGDRGKLHILEYSGGSLANALSGLCASLAIPLTLLMPDVTDPSVVRGLRQVGTEVVLSPAEHGFYGIICQAEQMAAANPGYSFLYQHVNEANLWMHRETTGREIVEQLPSGPDDAPIAWVASIGTGGTLVGVYGALKQAYPQVQAYVTSPAELAYGTAEPPDARPKFLGSGGFGHSRRQPFMVEHGLDDVLAGRFTVAFSRALEGVRELHKLTGLRVGSSAAANWLAASEVAERLGSESTVVTVFPSSSPSFEWQLLDRAMT